MHTDNIHRIVDIAAHQSDVLALVSQADIGKSHLLLAMQFALDLPLEDYADDDVTLEFTVAYAECLIRLRNFARKRDVDFETSEEAEALALAAYVDAQINRLTDYCAWLDGN